MKVTSKIKSIPWFTLLIVLTCLAMFFGFVYMSQHIHDSIVIYEKIGAPPSLKIYQGQYWGVFLNSFLHHKPEFLTVNLIGIIIFGSFIERRTNFYTLFILGFIASISTSLVQLTLTGDAGIGMIGVNFYFASYIKGRSLFDDYFKMKYAFSINALIFAILVWACFMNYYYYGNFGVESMTSGIIFGFITGFLVGIRKKWLSYAFALTLLLGLSSILFYAPWSLQWNLFKAYEAHKIGDYKNAKHYYNNAIEIHEYCSSAHNNLRLIKIDEMCDAAYKVHESKDYLRANEMYQEILEIDPENKWVKEQIKKLP